MGLPKSVRFEILKRDNFTCRYCGRASPEVVLNVDHVTPTSKGGTDDWDNLITSCFDCNAGKSGRPIIHTQEETYEQFKKRIEDQVDKIQAHLQFCFTQDYAFSDYARSTVRRYIKALSFNETMYLIEKSCERAGREGLKGIEGWREAYGKFQIVCMNKINL